MNRTYLHSVCLTLLSISCIVASCAKEEVNPNGKNGNNIEFVTKISDNNLSRATSLDLDIFNSFYVTCFNTADIPYVGNGAAYKPYFSNVLYERNGQTSHFVTDPYND